MIFTKRPQVKKCLPLIEAATHVFPQKAVEAQEFKFPQQAEKTQKLKQGEPERDENSLVPPSWAASIPSAQRNILGTMTEDEKKLQECKYEIITSQRKYVNSLGVIITNFKENENLSRLCSIEQWDKLFGNFSKVYAVSQEFLADLNEHFSSDIMLTEIYTILRHYAVKSSELFVEYCRNIQNYKSILKELKGKCAALKEVEWTLTLESGLLRLCKRVTDLEFILKKILEKSLKRNSDEYKDCEETLNQVSKVAKDCDSAVGAQEEKYDTQNPKSNKEKDALEKEAFLQEGSDEEDLQKVLQMSFRQTHHKHKKTFRAVRRTHSWGHRSSWQV